MKNNLTLPEWAWLNTNDLASNELEGRCVLCHIDTNTIIEFLLVDDNRPTLPPGTRRMQFIFENENGHEINYIAAIYCSILELSDQVDVIDEAIRIYKKHLKK